MRIVKVTQVTVMGNQYQLLYHSPMFMSLSPSLPLGLTPTLPSLLPPAKGL